MGACESTCKFSIPYHLTKRITLFLFRKFGLLIGGNKCH